MPPQVLIAGRMDGWMGLHLSQLARGFAAADAPCDLLNYRDEGPSLLGLRRLLLGKDEARVIARRTAKVLDALRRLSPAVFLTMSGRLDFAALREAYRGALVFWDMDGPAGALARGDFPFAAF